MTDNGPVVNLPSPFELEGLKLTPVTILLTFGMSRSECINYLKTFEFKVSTTIDYNPILTELHKVALSTGTKELEEIELEQKVVDGNEWYVDESGLEVYAYSFLSKESQFKDLRYD